ncbi:MAG: GtrA family protein [Elusimicrobiaceae bacterium]|nr:GtrA family protein [Elusimicrobiaceae bacterium]
MLQKISVCLSRLTKVPEQFIRFLIIGTLNTAFAYGLYALFIFVGCHYALAVFLSTVIGICFSFKTLGAFVFDNPDNRLIFKFFSVYVVCYFVNVGILKLLTGSGMQNLYLAGLISSFLVALVSFFLNKFVVFRRK